MRIGLAALGRSTGGPRTYARSLVASLRGLPGAPQIRVFADEPSRLGAVDGEAVRVAGLRGALRPLGESLLLPGLARRERIDLLHGTKHSLPPRLPCPGVVSIHDLAPFREPETFPRLAGAYLRAATAAAARRAEAIVTGSEASARDIRDVLGAPREKVAVVPYGVEERFFLPPDPARIARVATRIALPRPIVLCVGTIQPRKGQREVLAAIRALGNSVNPAPSLLFVGRRGWLTRAFEADLARSPGDRVRWIAGFPDEDLPAVYACSDLLVSASRLEGFGLAVAEAMACGLPVLALADGSIPELLGDAGALVPSAEAEPLAAGVRRLLEDGASRSRLAEAGRARARALRWERSAAAHLRLYASVIGRGEGGA